MTLRKNGLGICKCGAAGLLALVTSPGAALENPASGTLSTGETIEIIIDDPVDGSTVQGGEGLILSGRTNIPEIPVSDEFNVLYVVDVSGSTGGPTGQDCDSNNTPGDSGDDYNGDGTLGDTLDCEISGILALNNQLGVDVNFSFDGGVVPFGSAAVAADVGPAAGSQTFTSPLLADVNGNGVSDLEEVARSLDQGGIALFQSFGVGTGTDFNDALAAMQTAFGEEDPIENNVAFFLSDGVGSLATGPGSPLAAAAAAGTRVNTYSVGANGAGCAPGSNLKTIADATGSNCFEVTDPTQLAVTLVGTAPRGIDHMEVVVNGSAPITSTTFVDALGNWGAFVPAELVVGPTLLVEVTVVATDGTRVTACVTYIVEDTFNDEDADTLDDGFEESVMNRFAPFVHLHPDDDYRPASVEWFLDRVELDFYHLRLDGRSVCEHEVLGLADDLNPSSLVEQEHPVPLNAPCRPHRGSDPLAFSQGESDVPGASEFFLDIPPNDPFDARNGSSEGERDWTCYAHVFPAVGGGVNIQYWFAYPYNDLNVLGVGKHEGDWEHVTVRVDATGSTIERMYYSAHNAEGRWFDPNEISTVGGDRPVVYSATRSHASYPTAGTQSRPFPLPDDETEANEQPWDCQLSLVNVGECAHPFPEGRWIRFNGRWGGDRPLPVVGGDSPRGPAFQDSWCGDVDDSHPNERMPALCQCP